MIRPPIKQFWLALLITDDYCFASFPEFIASIADVMCIKWRLECMNMSQYLRIGDIYRRYLLYN